jgi:predicted outer membrane repeat protein
MYLTKMTMVNAVHTGNINAVRCDVRNNTANIGGGVYANETQLISSIVANNSATTQGGGAYLTGAGSNLIACSVVRNNAASNHSLFIPAGASATVNSTVIWGSELSTTTVGTYTPQFTAIQGTSTGTENPSLHASNTGYSNSPNFVNPSTTNGASTTEEIAIMSADWSLQSGSFLVDKGENSSTTIKNQLPQNDLHNHLRICSRLDIGALESGGCTPPITTNPPTWQKITWDSTLTTLQYGEQLTLNASMPVGAVRFASSNEAIAKVEGSTLTALGVGVVEIVAYENGNEQNFIQQTLTVAPRKVTIVAEGKIKVKGEADPKLTYVTMPTNVLVGQDTFSGELIRTPGDSAGVYDIFQGTLSLSASYEITFVGAKFTINDEGTYGSRVYYVRPDGMDSYNGISWGSARASIQSAIESASKENPKAEVWIAAGRYSISEPLIMVDGVNVYGGFAGNLETSVSQRPPVVVGDTTLPGLTIIDGKNATQLLRQLLPFTTTTTWDGITFINGNTSADGGGVVLQRNGALRNCNVVNCQTTGLGGGVMCHGGGNIDSSYIARNRAGKDGGGVYLYGYSPIEKTKLENSTIDRNSAGGNGGGILANYQIEINRCTVSNNDAEGNGGGVYGSNSASLFASVIARNRANNGGGAYGNGKLDLDSVTIQDNYALLGGGAYLREGSTAYLCTIIDNEAVQNGGGIYLHDGGKVNASSVLRNTAQNGAGVFFSQNGTLRSCTVSNNSAEQNGGGTYLDLNGTVASSAVRSNQSRDNGGGVYINQAGRCDSVNVDSNSATLGGGLYVRRSGTFNAGILQNNMAADNGGGAFFNQSGNVTESLIASNQAGRDGGGTYCAIESRVQNNRIINNVAVGNGGGIFCDKSNSIFNNLVANNTAENGGGIYAKTSNNITGSTVVHNRGLFLGGGIFYTNGTKLTNSIAWGNASTAPEHSTAAQINYSGTHSISYCAVECDSTRNDTIAGEGNLRLSTANDATTHAPHFRSTSGHIGASTDSVEAANSLTADWRLSSEHSACYNSGSNEEVPQYAHDLLGMPRIYNEETVDMGAYEWVPDDYTDVAKMPSKVEKAHLYPNPTDGEISIVTSFLSNHVEVFSLNGALLHTAPLTGSTLNLSNMPGGTLIIRLTGQGKVAVGKVVKR